MSASTLSVTANPRRRPTPLPDVKQAVDIVNDSQNPETTLPNPLPPQTKDVSSHSHPLPKKPTSQTGRTTRTRKPTSATQAQKPPRPRWVTLLRILTKQLLALLILAGLVQMVRRMVLTNNSGAQVVVGGLSEMEGRLSVVENSMRTTAKMLQVQVEVVDKKVESLVGDVRRDVVRRVEESVREFDTRVARLETAVGEIKERELGYASKAEVEKVYEELKRGGNDVNYDLDEVRRAAREVVEREMERHVADGLGRVDYALESGGGRVVRHSEVYGGVMKGGWFGKGGSVSGDAGKMLRPSFGEPGQCFALKGSQGFVVVRLRQAVVFQGVTLEHVAKV